MLRRGKTVVITGGTSGIGEVAAIELAKMGARIVLVARDNARGNATLARLRHSAPGIAHSVHFADLLRLAEMKRVADQIAEQESHIDVLINNAGALFATRREKALLSQWEVGVGLVAGGGPMARLPRLMGRGRALEVLLSSNDIGGDLAEAYGYVNRSLPDGELDSFVDALATRIASFDKWAIANTKRLVNAASLPPDVEIAAGWDACMTSIARPAAQERIKALMERGFHKPGEAENRLGFYEGQLGR